MKVEFKPYSIGNSVSRVQKNSQSVNKQGLNNSLRAGFSTISFTGGNKGDVMHIVAECPPYCKEGGVATVANDYRSLFNVSPTEKGRTAMVLPYYNGDLTWDKTAENVTSVDVLRVPKDLPADHPLYAKGLSGKPFYTNCDLTKMSTEEVLRKGNYFLLDEVSNKTMSFGLEKSTPIKLFRILDKNQQPTNDFMVFTERTAMMPKPYADGSYSSGLTPLKTSWKGDTYACFDKATVELMEDVSKSIGKGFDPGTVVCSDAHAAYASHYMAEKNAKGLEFFKGKKPIQIIHNGGDGYIGMTSSKNMLANLLPTDQIEKLRNTEGYKTALFENKEEEFLSNECLKLFGRATDSPKEFSALDVPFYYTSKNYVPQIATVSEGYCKSLGDNPEIAPHLQKTFDLQGMIKDEKLVGKTNPLNDPTLAPDRKLSLKGYGEGVEDVTLKDGTLVKKVEPLRMFDAQKLGNPEHIREVKKEAKMNIIDRFSGKYIGSDKQNLVMTGLPNKEVKKMYGHISPKYAEALKNGEDIKMYTSWGRGDFQKGLDEVIDSFVKHVTRDGAKDDSFLLLGGDLGSGNPESDIIVKRLKTVFKENPSLEGRIAFCDGFMPGNAIATAADYAIFPSRTAPCELTDLEAMKKFCIPVVSNCQGLGQKNFDPNIAEEAAKATGFKTQHEFFMSKDEALKTANETTRKSFTDKVKSLETKIKSLLQSELKTNDVQDSLVKQKVEASEEYKMALRTLRDEAMSDELAEKLKQAEAIRATETEKQIYSNIAKMDTTWEGNGYLSQTGKSTGELYREAFRADNVDIDSAKVLNIKVAENVQAVAENGTRAMKKLVAPIVLSTVAVAGIAGAIIAKSKSSKEQASGFMANA